MKFKFLNRVFITCTFFLTFLVSSANAGLITIGALSSDNDGFTTVITDTLNKREWLRWDVLADDTYAQTLAKTLVVGGTYFGWEIATANDVNLFLNALYNGGDHSCENNDTTLLNCKDNGTQSSEYYTALLGDSYEPNGSDAAWFYDDGAIDNNFDPKAGYLLLGRGSLNTKYNEVATIPETDTYSNVGGVYSTNSDTIGWLMYRPTSVTEPSTLFIFASGIMGLISLRFNQKP
jgi:hypothetical protein